MKIQIFNTQSSYNYIVIHFLQFIELEIYDISCNLWYLGNALYFYCNIQCLIRYNSSIFHPPPLFVHIVSFLKLRKYSPIQSRYLLLFHEFCKAPHTLYGIIQGYFKIFRSHIKCHIVFMSVTILHTECLSEYIDIRSIVVSSYDVKGLIETISLMYFSILKHGCLMTIPLSTCNLHA